MWSDKLTERMASKKPLFDLVCTHPERGSAIVEKDLPLERATEIATEGGIDDAEFKLECAWSDQYCVEIQRPDRYPEYLQPHDWD